MLWLSAGLLVSGVALGVLLSTHWDTPAVTAGPVSGSRRSSVEAVAATIKRLEVEQAELKGSIAELRAKLDLAQDTGARQKIALRGVKSELDREIVAAGLASLKGPGVIASFDDSAAKTVPENEDPAKYIVHEYDLRDVLNTLWGAGAEAISVNGERIVANTSLYCVGTTVICNVTRLSPPYEVRAIGDPQAISAALSNSSQMEKFNQRARIYDLPINVQQSSEVTVPAYTGSFTFKYAHAAGDK